MLGACCEISRSITLVLGNFCQSSDYVGCSIEYPYQARTRQTPGSIIGSPFQFRNILNRCHEQPELQEGVGGEDAPGGQHEASTTGGLRRSTKLVGLGMLPTNAGKSKAIPISSRETCLSMSAHLEERGDHELLPKFSWRCRFVQYRLIVSNFGAVLGVRPFVFLLVC